MPKSLVIVESPTKARTIAKFLGPDYVVESSIGHVRDLPDSAEEIPPEYKKQPWSRLGIDIEHGFRPLYVVSNEKKKQISKLKSLLKSADALYLATDEDREGESISWHLKEVLQPKVPTQRLVFHEITKEAIQKALQSTREIDDKLVAAQETRRLLDRLYGYEISPLLWRKIAPALSAGRVQSVAVRMVVQRERERMAFHSATYWDLLGEFAKGQGQVLKADLISLDGKRLVTGRDFDSTTGKLQADREGLVHLDEDAAQTLREGLQSAEWSVTLAERKPYTSQPAAPFTTSTLQQEAGRKLGFTAQRTMAAAQSLYERGYITYMRTDSTTLSDQALNSARSQIRARYGEESLPAEPRVYRTKVKNAQEAHEAIRPAGDIFRLPESLRGETEADAFRLYDLIWKRTIASQMADARGERMTVQVQGQARGQGQQSGAMARFQATGRTITFPGYLRAHVEGSDDPEAELSDQENLLPALDVGDRLERKSLECAEHTTQPPARYTEASLIKELEKEGIGRPSTYASIISTIQRRAYVEKKGSALVPTFTAVAVVRLLEQYFRELVDNRFTATMENTLDSISNGEQESLPYLREFYFGTDGFAGLKKMLDADIDPRQACTIPLGKDSQNRQIDIRVGKYGPYLEREGERTAIPADQVPDELTTERAEDLLAKGASPDVLGTHPETGQNVYVKTGRYGAYVQMGETGEEPKMKSLLPGQTPETLTLEAALQLLTLPRTVGTDPDTEEDIVVDLGRYGPYARRGKDTRTLPSVDLLFTIDVPQSKELFAQSKGNRPGQATVLKELGTHPDSEAPVRLLSGRYGPYVSDGKVNASLPRGTNPETLTFEEGLNLLAEKAARGPAPRGRAAAGKRAAAKSGGAKKAAKGALIKAGARKTAPAKKKPVVRKRRAQSSLAG